jgi:hypothetical protein
MALVHRDVDAAGVLVDEQNFIPRLAAVGGFENAALRVRFEHVSHRGRKDDVRVARIDRERRRHVRVAQPRIRPGLAGVGRFVDAVARVEVTADVGLAGTRIDDVRVRVGDRDRADRARDPREFAVGDVRPVLAVVGALPNTTLDPAEIEEIGVAGHARDGDHATTDVGADAAPSELAHQFLSRGLCGGRGRGEGSGRKR